MTGQSSNLSRVRSKIADLVLAFVAARLASDATFHGSDLVAYVCQFEKCSPSSPDRILRLLADEGRVKYRVLNRRQSLYRVFNTEPVQQRLWT